MGQTCCGTGFLEGDAQQEVSAYEKRDGQRIINQNREGHQFLRQMNQQEISQHLVNAEMFRDPTYQDSVERYNVVYRK